MAFSLCTILLFGAAEPQTVRLHGVALLPDGQPAVGATVIGACWHSPTVRATTDRNGRFSLVSEFAGPANITTITADGKFAGKLWIAAQSIRRRANESLSLKLTPTWQVNILVKKEGKPAANVQVGYTRDLPPQRTDERGRTSFAIPAAETSVSFSAWDPIRGVGGASLESKNIVDSAATIDIELQTSGPATFSVVDEFDRPAVAVKLSANCRFPNGAWFVGEYFPDSHGETDANGKWSVPWMPAKRDYTYAEPTKPEWKNDGVDDNPKVANPGKMHVRRSHRLKGRVEMPPGVSPEKLLVEASSYGPRSRGTSSGARVRPDGSFDVPVV